MERKEKVGLLGVGILGIISAVFGLAAEATRIQESQVTVTNSECIFPTNNPASGLALTAAVVLMVARIITIVLTGCSCCKKNPNRSIPNCTFAMACLVMSWFTFVIAQLMLVGGAITDGQRGTISIYYYCSVVRRGHFAIAASLSLTSVMLGISYSYAFFSAKRNGDLSSGSAPSNQIGIAMGQPIPPTSAQDPVFVHEDAYIRRQFT